MAERTGFPRSQLKTGMVVRLECKNDEGREWTSEGVIQIVSWSNILQLRGDYGDPAFIDWDCILHVELLSLLPPEEYADCE